MLSDLVRRRGIRARRVAAAEADYVPDDDLIDDPALLSDDLQTMERELRHRDAYIRGLQQSAQSPERLAKATLVSTDKVDDLLAKEGPLDRLRDLYTFNEDSEPSYELFSLCMVTMATFTLLNVRFTVQERRTAVAAFQERNKITVFASNQHAERRMTDYATMRALRLGLKRSAGALVWVPLFLGGAQLTSAALGQTSAWDFVPSGAAAGALVRGVHGMRPLLGGAVLGSCVGLLVGCTVYGLTRQAGFTYEELRRYKLTERTERDARLMAKYGRSWSARETD